MYYFLNKIEASSYKKVNNKRTIWQKNPYSKSEMLRDYYKLDTQN